MIECDTGVRYANQNTGPRQALVVGALGIDQRQSSLRVIFAICIRRFHEADK